MSPDEAVVGEVAEERLAPPLGVLARVAGLRVLGVVEVVVHGDAVVEPAVEEGERDVVVDVEAAVGVVRANAGEPVSRVLVAVVRHGVVDRVEADQALVDVGSCEVHPVVVEPEEALLLALQPSRRPVQVQLVDPHLRAEPRRALGAPQEGVVRVAVTLGRGVAVVQVGEEGVVGCAEVLPVQAVRVLVEVVREADERRLAVLGVDHRPRERPVEAVDGARRQRPLQALRHRLAVGVEGHRGPALRVDREYLRGGEGVRCDLDIDLVDQRVRRADVRRPLLVGLVAQRVLLPEPRTRRVRPVLEDGRRRRCQRLRHVQRVCERREDERAGREHLGEEDGVPQGRRRRREGTVGRQEAPARHRRNPQIAGTDDRRARDHAGPDAQDSAALEARIVGRGNVRLGHVLLLGLVGGLVWQVSQLCHRETFE